MGTPKSHKYLFDIPADLWQKSNRKAHAQGLTLRSFLVNVLQKEFASPSPSELIPVLDMQQYQRKLRETSRVVDDLVTFLDNSKTA